MTIFIKKGETIFTKDIFEEIGGKGINQAVAAARIGVDVSFLVAIGDDYNGKLCKELLQKENIKDCLSLKKGIPTTFAFILVDKNVDNQVTGYHGAELTKEDVLNFSDEICSSDIYCYNRKSLKRSTSLPFLLHKRIMLRSFLTLRQKV